MTSEVYIAIQAMGLAALLLAVMALMVAGIIWMISHAVGRGNKKE